MISQSQFRKRLLATLLLITFLFVLVASKLFYTQIVSGEELRAKALDQWTRDVPLKAERGSILDANGLILAGTETSYSCFIRPSCITDPASVAKAISDATGIAYDRLYEKIAKKGQSEICVAKKITKDAKNKIIDSGVEGVYFSKDISRYYPYGNFASQLLGFCNIDTSGQSGLEYYYNDYLEGVDGLELTKTDIIGRELDDTIYYIPSIEGYDISLCLDKHIQYIAESAVVSALEKHQAKSAGCIVLDLNSGGVVAMAQAPSYDLNNIDRSNLNELFEKTKLQSICNVYETGSVFKIITIAAALEEGVVSENDVFYCSGSRTIDGQRIKCWKTKGHGSQTFAEGVKNSCNCVFMDLALRVGLDKMYEYYELFNLTSKTNIDFLGEGSGLLISKEKAKNVDLARMGFGQAIAVTPIALISSVSAILNGGIYNSPYILDKVETKSGMLVYNHVNEGTRIVSEKTSEITRRLLLGVVSDGSGRLAGVDGYNVGGKTGTAQKYKNGSIDRGKYLSSFIGYCTYENPQYAVYFYVDEPQGYLYYGSQVAAPYVGEIFKQILNYKKEPKSNEKEKSLITLPDFTGLDYATALIKARKLGIYIETEGEGEYITSQFPVGGLEVYDNSVVFLRFS